MSRSQSNDARTCGECGAELPAEAKYCWLCGRAVQPTAATVARPSAPLEPRAAFQFGLSTIILAITIVAVLLGVFRMSPGLGVLLAVAVAPALLRVAVVSAKARSRGESVSPDRKVSIFLRTAGATLGVVGAVAAVLIVLAAVAVLSAVSAILSICTGGF